MMRSYARVTLMRGIPDAVACEIRDWWSAMNIELPSANILNVLQRQSTVGLGLLKIKGGRSRRSKVISKRSHVFDRIREAVQSEIGKSYPGYRVNVSEAWGPHRLDQEGWKDAVTVTRIVSGVELNGTPWKAGHWGLVRGSNIHVRSSRDRRALYVCEIEYFYHVVLKDSGRDVLIARIRPFPVVRTSKCHIHTINHSRSTPKIPKNQLIVFANFICREQIVLHDSDRSLRVSIPILQYSAL